MIKIRQTAVFAEWLAGLKDVRLRTRVVARIDRLAFGNAGDVAPIGEGISELRLHFGSGYRIYFVRRGALLIILLCGGDKRTQRRDIEEARTLARALEET